MIAPTSSMKRIALASLLCFVSIFIKKKEGILDQQR